MNTIERIALSAAFMAAAVAAGLSLSLVPNVELVTLVVFSSGVLLGASSGSLVGAAAMVIYVLANSALRGFPPSPLPILAAQAMGMAISGGAGGLWRRLWSSRTPPRRELMWALPAVGALLGAINQVLLNGVSASLFAAGDQTWMGTFFSGMAFGAVQILTNAVLFTVAAPGVVLELRRMARRRGWWRGRGAVLGMATLGLLAGLSTPAASAVDAALDSTRVADLNDRPRAGRLSRAPTPLWQPMNGTGADVQGASTHGAASAWTGAEPIVTIHPGLPVYTDRWALGWGRSRFTYDGVPLDGPVHAFAEPPDLPLAWRGSLRERFTATGTRIDLGPPPGDAPRPVSQVSLTTGGFGQRSTEFMVHRNLGPVNVAANFTDREQGETGDGALTRIGVDEIDATRLWLRLESRAGLRPDWSVDVSDGTREAILFNRTRIEHNTRRLYGTLRGPTLGGETRLALHLRRQAIRTASRGSAVEEVIMDGFTAQADWAPPGPVPVQTSVRWDRDRRRGLLDENRTLDGVRAAASITKKRGALSLGAELTGGTQDPYGGFMEAAVVASLRGRSSRVSLSVSREEGLPPLIDTLDRPGPEYGLEAYLEAVETARSAESVDAVRLEASREHRWYAFVIGVWGGRQRGYIAASNPVWGAPGSSPYALDPVPGPDADVAGVYGEGRLGLERGVYATGRGRVHNRDLEEIPYLPRWSLGGDLHWRRMWFKDSIDLDASVGGVLLGPRRNPVGEEFGVNGVGNLRLTGRIDNGIFWFALENFADNALDSDFRSEDTVTPLLVPERRLILGLTMYLFD